MVQDLRPCTFPMFFCSAELDIILYVKQLLFTF